MKKIFGVLFRQLGVTSRELDRYRGRFGFHGRVALHQSNKNSKMLCHYINSVTATEIR